MLLPDILLIFLLIIVNGFFAASEISLISLRKSRVRHLVKSGSTVAKRVQKLQEEPERFLAAVQIGVTLVGTFASTLGGVIAIERIKPFLSEVPIEFVRKGAEPIAVGIVVTIITYVTLVAGELVPKSLALRYSERIAFMTSAPIDFLSPANLLDHAQSIGGVPKVKKGAHQLLLELCSLGPLLSKQINPPREQTVSFGGWMDRLEFLGGFSLKPQPPLLLQPVIEIDLFPDGTKTMIREDKEFGIGINLSHDFSEGSVEFPVKPEKGVTMQRRFVLPSVPEKVVHPVGLHDMKLKKIPRLLFVKMETHFYPLPQGLVKVLQKGGFIASCLPGVGIDPVSHGLESLRNFFGIGNLIDVHA